MMSHMHYIAEDVDDDASSPSPVWSSIDSPPPTAPSKILHPYLEIGKCLQDLRKSVFAICENEIENEVPVVYLGGAERTQNLDRGTKNMEESRHQDATKVESRFSKIESICSGMQRDLSDLQDHRGLSSTLPKYDHKSHVDIKISSSSIENKSQMVNKEFQHAMSSPNNVRPASQYHQVTPESESREQSLSSQNKKTSLHHQQHHQQKRSSGKHHDSKLVTPPPAVRTSKESQRHAASTTVNIPIVTPETSKSHFDTMHYSDSR